jgi:hypothetical protein
MFAKDDGQEKQSFATLSAPRPGCLKARVKIINSAQDDIKVTYESDSQ